MVSSSSITVSSNATTSTTSSPSSSSAKLSITITPASYNTTTYLTAGLSLAIPTATTRSIAPGSPSNCAAYRDYVDVGVATDQRQSLAARNLSPSINNCTQVAIENAIALNDLLNWNPSLQNGSCVLAAGYSYCVLPSNATLNDTANVATCASYSNLVNNYTLPNTTQGCTCYESIFGYSSNCEYESSGIRLDLDILTS